MTNIQNNQNNNVAVSNVNKEEKTMKKNFAHFAAHSLLTDIKKDVGVAHVQKVTLLPMKDHKRIFARLSTSSVQVTPLNRGYMANGVTLQNVIGSREVFKRGSKDVVILDVSAIANVQGMADIADARTRGRFALAEVDGKVHVFIDLDGVLQDISVKPDNMGNFPIYSGSKFEALENIRYFNGENGCALNTSSQGRAMQIACFENGSKKAIKRFIDALDESTLDEFQLNKELVKKGSAKAIAAIATRLSAHATGMGLTSTMGCAVPTYAILFSQNGNIDGRLAVTSSLLAKNVLQKRNVEFEKEDVKKLAKKVEGLLIQCRPYTVKGEALVESQCLFDLELAKENLLRVDVTTASEEMLLAIYTMLSKELRARKGIKLSNSQTYPELLKGYTGIVIAHGDNDEPIGLAGDLNAFKDLYDVTRVDGLNILSVSHFSNGKGWLQGATSAQSLKCVYRAATEDDVIAKDLEKTIHGLQMRQLKKDATLKTDEKVFGSEMIDTSYVPRVVRDLNPKSLLKFPSVYKMVVEDVASRMANHINLDRYHVAGHSGVITSDPAYSVWGQSVLKMDGAVIEIYDPLFDRYAEEVKIDDNKGVGMKYPAVGAREYGLLQFVSEKEMIKRVEDLGAELGKDEAEIKAIAKMYRTFKEGGIMIPANLDGIARILAGCDLDGDKLMVYFPDEKNLDFVHILWFAHMTGKLSPRAVAIGKGGEASKTVIKIDASIFSNVMGMMVLTGNKSVGTVTNAFRILSNGLLDGSKDTRKFIGRIFRKIFNMASNGEGEYTSQISVENIDGVDVYKTKADALACVEAEIQKSAYTWANIKAALEDFDVVARHIQELTIDAQKKFCVVEAGFVDRLGKDFSLSVFEEEINFNMNWEHANKTVELSGVAGYKTANGVVSPIHLYANEKKIISADFFARNRARAATYAMKLLNPLRAHCLEKLNEKSLEGSREYSNIEQGMNIAVKTQIRHALGMARTALSAYGELEQGLRDEYIYRGMSRKDVRETEKAIRKEARARLGDLLDAVSNEIRVIANDDETLTMEKLVTFIAGGKDVVGGVAGKVLKEELCYWLAKHSEIEEVSREIDGSSIALVLNAKRKDNTVHVVDGEVEATGVMVDLVDGYYTVHNRRSKGLVELTRPICDFVVVPKADKTRKAFRLDVSAHNGIEQVEAGASLSIRRGKIDKKGDGKLFDAMGLYNGDNQLVAVVDADTFKKIPDTKVTEFSVVSPRYDNVTGNFAAVTSSVGKDGRRYFVVVLDGVNEQGENPAPIAPEPEVTETPVSEETPMAEEKVMDSPLAEDETPEIEEESKPKPEEASTEGKSFDDLSPDIQEQLLLTFGGGYTPAC